MKHIHQVIILFVILFVMAVPVHQSFAQLISEDLYVDGNQCVGTQCVGTEIFGYDTLRFKADNLRMDGFVKNGLFHR